METTLARVTISWKGWTEVVFTSSSFKCHGKVAWIDGMPYPYDSLHVERG